MTPTLRIRLLLTHHKDLSCANFVKVSSFKFKVSNPGIRAGPRARCLKIIPFKPGQLRACNKNHTARSPPARRPGGRTNPHPAAVRCARSGRLPKRCTIIGSFQRFSNWCARRESNPNRVYGMPAINHSATGAKIGATDPARRHPLGTGRLQKKPGTRPGPHWREKTKRNELTAE